MQHDVLGTDLHILIFDLERPKNLEIAKVDVLIENHGFVGWNRNICAIHWDNTIAPGFRIRPCPRGLYHCDGFASFVASSQT